MQFTNAEAIIFRFCLVKWPVWCLYLGPFTEEVVRDFWLMIWQERPSAIVMVTRAIENSKVTERSEVY